MKKEARTFNAEKTVFSIKAIRKFVSYIQNNKTGPLSYTIYINVPRVAIMSTKEFEMQYLDEISKTTE